MRRWAAVLAFTLAVLFLTPSALAEKVFPDCLRFTQETETQKLENHRVVMRTYPATCRPEIDAEIADLVNALVEAGRPFLPAKGNARFLSRLDSGASITRVGDRWMSFLVIGRVCHEGFQLWADFDTRVYNMETGEPVTLDMVIDAEKGGWEYLSACVREQLAAHFPDLEPDPARLDALCSREALARAHFTLSPGHLSLHYPAAALYPEHDPCLMRADIYYPELRPYMTDTAVRETDCSGYALVALTYDDGPAIGATDRALDQLRLYGAQATFFVVGSRIEKAPGIINREYDAGMSVQSHNWVHSYEGITADTVKRWTARMNETMGRVIGRPPVIMRAPGGNEWSFISAGCTLPLIHWSVISGDITGSDDVLAIGGKVSRAVDGDIVLMHDLDVNQGSFAAYYLPRLEARSVMTVTLQDLFALRGVTLAPRMVVTRVDSIRTYEQNK